mmetsp:Transcript_15593/g.52232  ORF Transcript_15593/g.52232 Transcript_15593/m.52232 type:complete len:95 (+) Transcript_15593:1947-2231(+)
MGCKVREVQVKLEELGKGRMMELQTSRTYGVCRTMVVHACLFLFVLFFSLYCFDHLVRSLHASGKSDRNFSFTSNLVDFWTSRTFSSSWYLPPL